jgi:hypothetical protein
MWPRRTPATCCSSTARRARWGRRRATKCDVFPLQPLHCKGALQAEVASRVPQLNPTSAPAVTKPPSAASPGATWRRPTAASPAGCRPPLGAILQTLSHGNPLTSPSQPSTCGIATLSILSPCPLPAGPQPDGVPAALQSSRRATTYTVLALASHVFLRPQDRNQRMYLQHFRA